MTGSASGPHVQVELMVVGSKGTVAAPGGVPDYPVTHRYIDRILSDWTHYREAAT